MKNEAMTFLESDLFAPADIILSRGIFGGLFTSVTKVWLIESRLALVSTGSILSQPSKHNFLSGWAYVITLRDCLFSESLLNREPLACTFLLS